MKAIAIILTFLISTNMGFSQSRKIDIPKNQNNNDTIYFYKIHDNQLKQLGLNNLLYKHDSICFRFWMDYQVLDFKISKSNRVICDLYSFVWVDPKKGELPDYKNRKLIFNKVSISDDTSLILWQKALNLGLFDLPTDSKINGWVQWCDGITYITEYSSDSIYKYSTYGNPNAQADSITEAKKVQEFYHFADTTIGLQKRFQRFTNGLPNGRYIYGMIVMEKAETKRKKN
ncbi:MAG TPA: hypothetical protein PK595_03675 [Bacteroidota bacterium]|nr:hypothetical protein [Bacteroidota bacterium]